MWSVKRDITEKLAVEAEFGGAEVRRPHVDDDAQGTHAYIMRRASGGTRTVTSIRPADIGRISMRISRHQ